MNNLGRAEAESYVVFHDVIRPGSELFVNVELEVGHNNNWRRAKAESDCEFNIAIRNW